MATTLTQAVYNVKRASLAWIYERNAITLSDGATNDYVSLFQTVASAGLSQTSLSVANIFQQFVRFRPLAGATLIEMQYSQYPFANRAIAANSGSVQPNRIQIEMMVDFGPTGIEQLANALGIKTPTLNIVRYAAILPFMQALRQKLVDHMADGGTFNLITPSQIYFDCLLENLSDVSDQSDGSPGGIRYVFSFIKPIISLKDANKILNDVATKSQGGNLNG
jgi:hypothetical protein